MSDRQDPSAVVAVLDLVKALLWPSLVLYLVVSLHQPLMQIAQSLPDILRRTKEIEVAGNRISVNAASPSPSPDIANVLKKLNESSLRYLMMRSPTIPFARCKGIPHDEEEINNLITLHLLSEQKNLNDERCPSSTSLTDLGQRTREYLISLVLSQVAPSNPADQTSAH